MSSRFQMALVTRVIETGDLRPLRMWGITHDELTDEDASILLEFVSLYFNEHGSVPRKKTIREKLPGIYFEETDEEDPEILCSAVAEELAEAKFRRLQIESQDLLERHGPLGAAEELQKKYMDISSSFGRTPTYVLGSRADIDFRALTSEQEVDRVVPYVWPTMQKCSGGARSGEFIVLYGKKKNAKTWALLEQAEFVSREGYKVLFITPEMPKSQIARRVYAIRAGFPYSPMRTKDLFKMGDAKAAENMMHLRRVIASFLDQSNFIIYDPEDEEGELRIDRIEGLVDEHKPDILLVDQMQYITMGDPNRELRHKLGDVSKRLKKISRVKDLPVMVSTQSNKDGDIAESIQIEQIADIVLWVSLNKETGIRHFKVAAARELEAEDWACFADFCERIHEVPPGHRSLRKDESKEEKVRRRSPKQQKLRGRK